MYESIEDDNTRGLCDLLRYEWFADDPLGSTKPCTFDWDRYYEVYSPQDRI